MKTIGLIGGMSWQSSLQYYRIINELTEERLGGFHSARCLLYSLDFEEVHRLQHQDAWVPLTRLMISAAQRLEQAGADLLLICTNTMHMVADEVQGAVRIPLLHIVDVTAKAIKARNQQRVGLLGTRFTMEHHFYKERLERPHGIHALIPSDQERQILHRILYDELCLGVIKDSSRRIVRDVIDNLIERGSEGIILGCTEIPMIAAQTDYAIPLYDTTCLHARAAVEEALETH